MTVPSTLVVTLLGVLSAAACGGGSAPDKEDDRSSDPDRAATTDAGSGGRTRDARVADARTGSATSGRRDAASDDEGESCSGVSAEAQARLLPTDIVWAIDTSGSMLASFPAIRDALLRFSDKLAASNVDARVVLLAGQELCVPAPLGSGQCGVGGGLGGVNIPGLAASAPDTAEPRFLHLSLPFGSGQGMGTILDNHGSFSRLLRPDARTYLVLTEDGAPPVSAQAVVDHVEGRTSATGSPAWTPPLSPGSWVFSGVVCEKGPGAGACTFAFVPPTTTVELIKRTNGVSADLALAGSAGADPFASLLDQLATRVIVGSELSCEYDIPQPPAGSTFDKERVNVFYGPASGAREVIPHASSDDCQGPDVAWAYDDANQPTKVRLCPAACDAVRENVGGVVDVEFGCATVLAI